MKIDLDFLNNRDIVWQLEALRGDMIVKMRVYAEKNPTLSLEEMQKKINIVANAQDYINETYELMNDFKRKMQLLELTNSKLLAQLNANDKTKL